MFGRLRALLETGDDDSTVNIPDSLGIANAAAVILLEVAWADHDLQDAEVAHIKSALQQLYDVSDDEAERIVERASVFHSSSTGLFSFTRQLNDHLDFKEKKALLVELWRMNEFGGESFRYEEHVIRRVADLLYVSHTDFIAAKLEAKSAPS